MRRVLAFCAIGVPVALFASVDDTAEVIFLGEVHDNPAHHQRQAELVADIAPVAIVWEMITTEQAAMVSPELVGDEDALAVALNWSESGWPAFEMYYPIFAAAPDAAHFGAALPRGEARASMGQPLVDVFGEGAAQFGLDQPLPVAQQAAREELQFAAHCDALPREMLPMMVNVQRLRDARIAQAALKAYEETGGPVAVITGNGHARLDWGAPAALALAAPDVQIFALGQAEDGRGAPDGGFDLVETFPPVDREDPCAALTKSQ